MDIPALFSKPLPSKKIRCGLCPHCCVIGAGKSGFCKTRYNSDGGVLVVNTYGRLSAVAIDPIEKKPLFHFRPGSTTLSIASAGCNLVCPFCQNHSLSQSLKDGVVRHEEVWTPHELVAAALKRGCTSISFTYSEPILSLEYAIEVAAVAKEQGIDCVFVTNGQATKPAADMMAQFLAAANVDLKTMNATAYKKELGGNLQATLDTIKILKAAGVWVEITTLVIPEFNDSDAMLTETARFIAGVDFEIPWHVSRFHPAYKWLDRPITPASTLTRARKIGIDAGLAFVYTGNISDREGECTKCPGCKKVIINRNGYTVNKIMTQLGHCDNCGKKIAGVGF